jgi:hypothetical protein
VVDLRGNVGTRLSKMDTGLCHAAILAAAGLNRLGLSSRIRSHLGAPDWLSAAGQGAIAIQVRRDDAEVSAIVAKLNHQPTMDATTCERAFLAALDGGRKCQDDAKLFAATQSELALLEGELKASLNRRLTGLHAGPACAALPVMARLRDVVDKGSKSVVVKTQPVDQCPGLRQTEHPGLGVAWLRQRCHGTHLDKPKAHGA